MSLGIHKEEEVKNNELIT